MTTTTTTAAGPATCALCGKPLVRDAPYCAACGERTPSARRKVRIALRLEVVFLALVIGMLAVFAYLNLHH